jgi:hypothetical protein
MIRRMSRREKSTKAIVVLVYFFKLTSLVMVVVCAEHFPVHVDDVVGSLTDVTGLQFEFTGSRVSMVLVLRHLPKYPVQRSPKLAHVAFRPSLLPQPDTDASQDSGLIPKWEAWISCCS